MNTNDFIELLARSDIVIFGTGFVANMFWQALELHGLADRVRFCVITKAEPGQRFHGLPVYSLHEAPFPEHVVVCMAVHETVLAEIREQIPSVTEKTVWINPYLIGLLYGDPLRHEKPAVDEIVAHQDHTAYWITVRYAAVKAYLEKSADYGLAKDLYVRALSLHCSPETAVRRLHQLEKLADSMSAIGFGEGYPPVRIDDNLQVIDGLHRMACSLYLGIPAVPAAIYKSSEIYNRLLAEKNRLPEPVLLRAGFSGAEMEFLRKNRMEIIRKAGVEDHE